MITPTPIPKSVKDHLVTQECFSLVPHPNFEILVTTPQPSSATLARYYESDSYISHTDTKKGFVSLAYQTVKKYALYKKVKKITKLNEGVGSLLDIGAGTGDFLKTAKNKGWHIEGVEVNEKARKFASQKGIELYTSLQSCKGKQFDVVTLWHVLEHLPDLENIILTIEMLVKPGGHLVIAVPNYNSFDASYYNQFWAAFDVPRHLWHFSQKGIRQLISPSFSQLQTSPMIFDSFYVSLLSERYKRQKAFALKAFWIGLRSNVKAMRSTEYSSLIYCFKNTKQPI